MLGVYVLAEERVGATRRAGRLQHAVGKRVGQRRWNVSPLSSVGTSDVVCENPGWKLPAMMNGTV